MAGDGEERGFEHLSEGAAEMSRGWQGNRGERGPPVSGWNLSADPPTTPTAISSSSSSAFHLSFALHFTSFLLSHAPFLHVTSTISHIILLFFIFHLIPWLVFSRVTDRWCGTDSFKEDW